MTQSDNKLMTQAEYARHRGCSRQAVGRAVAGSRIKTFGPDKLVDAELADVQWQRNSRARATSGAAGAVGGTDDDDVDGGSYNDWRVRREAAEAELAELRLGETRGELIRLSAVKSALGVVFSTARDALLQLPSRMSAQLAGESDPATVQTALYDEIHRVLVDLSGAGDQLGQQAAPEAGGA